jgi:hypothetical protein
VILGFIADSLRHNYNSSKELLTISASRTAVHGALGAFLVHVNARMAISGFLSEEESSRVCLRTGTDQNLPSDHRCPPVHKKVADDQSVALQVDDLLPDTPALHRGAFLLPLQRYVELLQDARQELAVKRYLEKRPQRPDEDMLDGDYQPEY